MDGFLAVLPPSSFAVVMGTGIISVGLQLDHREALSRAFLAIAALVWTALAVLLTVRGLRDPVRARQDVRAPAALTWVAGTAVLGSRLVLLGWDWAGFALLAIAFLSWLALLGPVIHNWATPTVGVSLMLAVSTESLAALAAMLTAHAHSGWLLAAALALFALGLAAYGVVIARFDFAQLLSGRGDHWITGGALAISTLALAQIARAARAAHELAGLSSALELIAVVLWALTIAWLPALIVAEALRPRLEYDSRRWSTVFPIGMYAACSFLVGSVAHATAITEFARVWIWTGVAAWVLVGVGMVRSGPANLTRRAPATGPPSCR